MKALSELAGVEHDPRAYELLLHRRPEQEDVTLLRLLAQHATLGCERRQLSRARRSRKRPARRAVQVVEMRPVAGVMNEGRVPRHRRLAMQVSVHLAQQALDERAPLMDADCLLIVLPADVRVRRGDQ